jgi:hypothetical protein
MRTSWISNVIDMAVGNIELAECSVFRSDHCSRYASVKRALQKGAQLAT